jgi:hypothetical protein
VISATSFGSTQWTRDRMSGESKRVLRGGSTLRRGAFACEWIETTPQIGKHLVRQGPGLASMLAAGEGACDRRGMSATRCGGLVRACALGRGAQRRPAVALDLAMRLVDQEQI